MSGIFNFLITPGLLPYGFCLKWKPWLVSLYAISDAVAGASCWVIPLALACVARKRQDIPFRWVFWMFAAFILASGTTHLMEVLTLWYPAYGAEGIVKAITAAAALGAAIALWPLVRRAPALPASAAFSPVSGQRAGHEDERNGTLAQLRQTEESFRLLVKGVRDYAIYMLDPHGVVITWNAGAERVKGYREEEIKGHHFSAFYTPEDREAGVPSLALETAAREGRYEAEGWRVRKDGSRFWANVVIDTLHDDAGRLVGFAKVTRDVTERKRAEEVLEQTRAALAQAQKMETIGQLAGGMAHDFNNMLTAILGSTSLLERRIGPQIGPEDRRFLSVIQEATTRAAALTGQLLAFSRKQTLTPRAVDANKLVTGMSELIRRTLGEQVAVQTVLAGGLWPAFADGNQLENAILNLAVNARDAMPDGGKLTLETGNVYLDEDYAVVHSEVAPGQYVMIAVSDTGTGMTEEVKRQAFEPFFTTKPEGVGTGLGLSQVFGFVKQSGGHIKLYSEIGHGTTVKIYLPRYAGEGVAEAEPELPYVDAPHGNETVLVVEDDEGVRQYVANALGHLGYRVLEAPDGPRALEIVGNNPGIALLLTDVVLPGLNGRKIAEQARAVIPGLKVMFMTGYARNAISHHGLLDKGVNLLPKPFTVEALARRVRGALDG